MCSRRRLRHHAAAFHTQIHDELVVTQSERGVYFRLVATGKKIWELLETPKTVEELCNELVSEYRVKRSAIEVEVLAFLADLERQELIQVER